MTPHNRRTSSARVVLNRNKPGTALTAFCLTRQVSLSSDSLRLYSWMFYRRGSFVLLGTASTSKVSLARSEHQGQDSDSASARPMHLALTNACDRGQKSPSVAISPGGARGTTAIFNTTPICRRGGRRRGSADRAG